MNTNYMVELSGVFGGDITVYIPERYYLRDRIDMRLVSEHFDGVLRVNGSSYIKCRIDKTRNYRPFVWVHSASPRDQINITCNVELEVTRTYSFLGWIEYVARSLARYLLKNAKKLSAPKW